MDSAELAARLRENLLSHKNADYGRINALTDSEIIESYLYCCKCHQNFLSEWIIGKVKNAVEFYAVCNSAKINHACYANN